VVVGVIIMITLVAAMAGVSFPSSLCLSSHMF
jgi:hypothetical protein